ncbi:MAG: isoleucine--tRNA ligase [candidate division Zixibacteria bacterium]|nr:isoleucine--tRNA ligase [candidate division Zixibacteria bacterium]
MRFDTFKDNFSLPEAEEKIIAGWERNQTFKKAQEAAKDRPHFVFYEGPPTANGRPGIHHVISRTVKDLICRYKYMQGFRVDRKGGWDTHGLPVEIEVEKKLKLDSKAKIVKYGIAEFNKQCRESVFKYLDEWNDITRRIGYWLDLDDAYVTLKNEYVETVWWILKNFHDRDLLYKGFKTVPFCPRCGTGLSSHEVAQGYEEVRDPSIFVKVKATDADFSYLVWTTTPWTLPSNAALCMKPDADYVLVEHEGEKLVLAEALVEKVFGEPKNALQRFKGTDFLKRPYLPLFDIFKDQADGAYFVINADFVTLEDGSGIVHVAPGFGADDYVVGQKFGLPVFQAIEANGIFKDFAGPYAGMFIKDADPIIIKDLKIAGRLFKKEIYEHNYPFCWRCHSPLIYIARQSWYLKTTQFKEQLIKNSNAINWNPDEIRTGRMLNWLENNVDWALSRERFWGTPLPIWICDDPHCGKQKAVGSIEQLRQDGIDVPDDVDLHKPMMDEVKLKCECGGTMTRVPEVIDCWFDSGAMPYAQWHYPFENKEEFEAKYPAQFIAEAVDQTRGWFYSLLAISTLLFDKTPFENVIVFEFILDKNGKKMSKSKGNVVDPFETVRDFGADPVRWYLLSTSNLWMPTKFDTASLQEVIRKYFDTLRNTYSFFALYANIDEVPERARETGQSIESYLEGKAGEPDRFDRWIVSRFNSLAGEVSAGLDKYEITVPVRAIQAYVIDELSNWYVRNNRRRFWAKGDDPSKMRAYLTLYRMLVGVCRLTAPVTPMVSEMIWRQLVGAELKTNGQELSVHLTTYPKPDQNLIDTDLEESMGLVERIVSLGRAARSRRNIKVRQPLSQLMVATPEGLSFDRLEEYLGIIKDELNVKTVASADDLDQYISYSAKLNFKKAGPRLGGKVKAAAPIVAGLDNDTVRTFDSAGKVEIEIDGDKVTLTKEEIDVNRDEKEGYAIESYGGVTVALATELSEELVAEGFARELVSKIQNMRKSSGFEVTDRINVLVSASDRLITAVGNWEDFVQRETLADSIRFADGETIDGSTEWNINGEKTVIAVSKV